MTVVNIHQAKTELSRLLEAVEAGKEIVIARGGKPVARLVAIRTRLGPRPVGRLAGKIRVPDDWDAALPHDVLAHSKAMPIEGIARHPRAALRAWSEGAVAELHARPA